MNLTTNVAALIADRAIVMAEMGKAQAEGRTEDAQNLYNLAIQIGGMVKALQNVGL